MLRIGKDRLEEISAHVTARYPEEACGLLIGTATGDRRTVHRIFRAENRNRARDRYDLDPADFRRADEAARRQGLDVVGIYHSHPDHPCRPSRFDRERAWEGYSYLILSVSVAGMDGLRSWVITGGDFREEPLETEAGPPMAEGAATPSGSPR